MANKYHEMFSMSDNDSRAIILRMIKPNSKVLEFGCATGNMTQYMKEELKCDVYIVEYEKEAFKKAVYFAEDGICGDINDFEWLVKFSNDFDYIIFADVLEHLVNPFDVLSKTKNILKYGGSVLISVPNIAHNDILLKLFDNKFEYTDTGLLDNTHVHFFTIDSLIKICNDCGYGIVNYNNTIMATGATEQKGISSSEILLKLVSERKGGMIFQNIVEIKKLEFLEDKNIIQKEICFDDISIDSKIYFDYGNGFSEDNMTIFKASVFDEDNYLLEINLDISKNIKNIRIDLSEYPFILLKSECKLDCMEIQPVMHNAISFGETTWFYENDPQIHINVDDSNHKLSCRFIFTMEYSNHYQNELRKIAGELNMDRTDTKEIIDILHNNGENNVKYFEQNNNNYEVLLQKLEDEKLSNNYIKDVLKKLEEDINAEQIRISELTNARLKQQEYFESKYIEVLKEKEKFESKIKELMAQTYKDKIDIDTLNCNKMELLKENDSIKRENDSIKRENEEIKVTNNIKIQELSDTVKEKENYYAQLVERAAAAEYWEQKANHINNTLSWKLTKPLRLPGYIRTLLKNKLSAKTIKEDVEQNRANANTIKEAISQNDAVEKSVYDNTIGENYNLTNIIKDNRTVKFSILMPVYNVEIKWIREAINSVKEQTYDNWELCIVDDASTEPRVRAYLESIVDERVHIKFLEKNQGISGATNEALDMASGEFVILMDNDDVITPDAIQEFYNCYVKTDADVIYSDQDIIDINGNHSCPIYKPNWSPDLFRSQMYIGHLCGFRREMIDIVGGFRKEFNGSQDYDLFLRLTEKTNKIEHIDKILYSWRSLPSSTAANPNAKPYAQYAGLNAVQEHLDRVFGENVAVAKETDNLFVYDVIYPLPNNTLISIIIPTKDHSDDLKIAIDSIYEKSSYRNFEIIILNNNSEDKETYEYFDKLKRDHKEIIIENAFYEFNWSKLNNHGIKIAHGDVYVFLNNDVKVLTCDWLERLASQALRKDVGAVGAMLLYDDGTIQHGGVIAGLGGWADHAYKGMNPQHIGTPFISPVVRRNVTAVTGACMAIAKNKIDELGYFDDEFIICGSDVEICVRALQKGFVNIYDPYIKLNHYESKSRGTFVPEIDFKKSYEMYTPFRENGDPYYNNNLDYNSFIPIENGKPVQIENKEPERFMQVGFPELTPIHFREVETRKERLNILLPSLNPEHVFGGIATAYKFFQALLKNTGMNGRVILVDAAPSKESIDIYSKEYVYVESDDDLEYERCIVPYNDRIGKTLPVSDNDYFILTGWWTAYCIQEEYLIWREKGKKINTLIYLVQDYEPGFYQWSSHYMLADSTYKVDLEQIAVFNSTQLKDYFDSFGYKFAKSFVFDPILNDGLKNYLSLMDNMVYKKKQILIYGRPNTARNAFALAVEALRKWVWLQDDISEWTILSAGEAHDPVELGNGKVLRSVGKLTIEQYAKTLEETFAGISLMVSPHPSYPPLEMSIFGVNVITNSYANKDISSISDNIISVDNVSPTQIAIELRKICDNYKMQVDVNPEKYGKYYEGGESFPFLDDIENFIKK